MKISFGRGRPAQSNPVDREAPPPPDALESLPFHTLFNTHGVLKSSAAMSAERKRDASLHFGYHERACVALAVAQMYLGGDYFEFGSEGMGTFRNFLSAFDIHGCIDNHPDTRFYAFDIFGDMTGASGNEDYFAGWHDTERNRMVQAQLFVEQHGLFVDRCRLVQGFFQNTLTQKLKADLRREGRAIGFAFLDCNITDSYRVVFDFIGDLLLPNAAYIYMDEYYCNDDVPGLFDEFCRTAGFRAHFMRSAGAFGALYKVVRIKR